MADNWLENLKVGDEVIVHGRWSRAVSTVDRVTSTQIVCGVCRYRKSDGRRVGWSGSGRPRLEEASPEAVQAIVDAVTREKAIFLMRHGGEVDKITTDQLRRIMAIINEPKPDALLAEREGK